MIKETNDYVRNETLPRFREIIFGSELWVAIAIAVAIAYWGGDLNLSRIKVSSVTGAVLNYSAIAFGFAVTGMTLAISIPDRKLAVKMAKTHAGKAKKCAYSSLIFVFSWTALSHLLLILFCIVLLAGIPDDRLIINLNDRTHELCEKIVIGLMSFLTIYGFLQFFITIITISQVGDVYINELQKEKDEE